MSTHKISLKHAILINLNIMIGAGIFINTIPFIKLAGPLSALIYLIVGILMMPLIFTIMELLKRYPGGSFYTYATNSLGKFWGFISSWSYFTAKLSSAAVMIHFSIKLIQSILPIFGQVNTLLIDAIIVSIFTYLNMQNMKTGSKIQVLFMVFKLATVLFVILASLYTILGNPLYIPTVDLSTLPGAIPQAIYVFAGFEAACSLSRHLQNPEKNGPKAVLISFFTALTIYIIYQFLFYQVISHKDLTYSTYTEGLPIFFSSLKFGQHHVAMLVAIFQLAIASSALGGAYGILFSNNWNLYTLAENNLLPFANKFKTLNQQSIPYMCLIVEFVLTIFYLLITQGNNVPLQQINSLGCTITYLISTVSLFAIAQNKTLPILAIISCTLLLSTFLKTNLFAITVFASIFCLGILIFTLRNKSTSSSNQ